MSKVLQPKRQWADNDVSGKIAIIHHVWSPGASASSLARAITDHAGERVTRQAVLGLYFRNRDRLRACPLNDPISGPSVGGKASVETRKADAPQKKSRQTRKDAWTEAEIELAAALWNDEGLPAIDIAVRVGRSLTSVRSKIQSAPHLFKKRKRGGWDSFKSADPIPPKFKAPVVPVPDPDRVTSFVKALEDGGLCKFPVDLAADDVGPDMPVCGCKAQKGKPYCEFHAGRVGRI